MAKQTIYPKADTKSQWFANKYPGLVVDDIEKILLHTTEGRGWAGYDGGAAAPNFTICPDFDKKTVAVRQHFPVNMSSRALVDAAGGVRTNRGSVTQIEIVGTSGWASKLNKAAVNGAKGTYLLPEHLYVGNFPDWYMEGIADLVGWISKEWSVPLVAPPQGFGPWTGATRFTGPQYDKFRGVLGHQHAPENYHTDPGNIDIEKIFRFAREINTASKPAPAPAPQAPTTDEEFIMAVEDKIVAAIEALGAKIGRDQSASDAYAQKVGQNTGQYVHAYLRDKGLTVKLDDETIAKLATAIKAEIMPAEIETKGL